MLAVDQGRQAIVVGRPGRVVAARPGASHVAVGGRPARSRQVACPFVRQPPGSPPAAVRPLGVVAVVVAKPAEEVALDGGLPDLAQRLVVLPSRGLLRPLPLALLLGLAEHVIGAVERLVAPLRGQGRARAVLRGDPGEGLLAPHHVDRDRHLGLRRVGLPRRL